MREKCRIKKQKKNKKSTQNPTLLWRQWISRRGWERRLKSKECASKTASREFFFLSVLTRILRPFVCVCWRESRLISLKSQGTNERKNKNLGKKKPPQVIGEDNNRKSRHCRRNRNSEKNHKVYDLFLFLQWKPFVILSKTTRRFLLVLSGIAKRKKKSFFQTWNLNETKPKGRGENGKRVN